MKKIIALAVLPVLIGLALPADAAAQRGFQVGVAGGPSFPLDHLAEEAGTGFHLLGSFGVELPLLPVGARADVLWQQFPDEHSGHFTALGGLLNATVRLPLAIPARPYVLGGVGFVRFEEPDEVHGDHTHAGDIETEFAYNIGAGVKLQLLGLGGFIEARFLDWGHGHRAAPVTIGIMF